MGNKTVSIHLVFFLLLGITIGHAQERQLVLLVSLPDAKVISATGDLTLLDKPHTMGSTMKGFLAIAAMRENWDPEKTVLCPASTVNTVPQERCWLVAGHGKVNLVDGLAYSCNVFFRSLAKELDRKAVIDVYQDYHLLDEDKLQRLQSANPSQLMGGDYIHILPGRQFGAYLAAFGGADLYEFSRSKDKVIGTLVGPAPKVPKRQLLLRGLRKGATDGTFKDVQEKYPNTLAFGKTGTAPLEGKQNKWRGVFVGFAPYPKPNRAVFVMVQPGGGATDAAPLGMKALAKKEQ